MYYHPEFQILRDSPQYHLDGTPQSGWIKAIYDPETGIVTTVDSDPPQSWAWPPPPPVTPDLPSFLEAVRKPVADHFLNTLVSRDFALTMSLRDAFTQSDLPNILKYWNEAIAAHSAALTATLDIEHEGQTRGDFARAKMVEFHIPVIINPDYTLSFQAP